MQPMGACATFVGTAPTADWQSIVGRHKPRSQLMRLPRFPEAIPVLVGEAVQLRELSEDDIPGWFARATDRESADLAGDSIPESIGEGAAWLKRHRDHFERKVGLRWAIVPQGAVLSVGTVGFTFGAANAGTASIGVVVARSSWGKGIGAAAVSLAVQYAFSQLRLSEVRAEVLQRNEASVRLLEKCGFRLTEVLPPTATEPEVLLLYTRTRGSTSVA